MVDGFLLNNEMDDFTSKPGSPNIFGLVQGVANKIEPGKRMLSSMSPTILEDEHGDVYMVVGGQGGPRIITEVWQAISNVVDFGMPVGAAIAAPRVHHQHLPDEISVEDDAIATAVRAGARRDGLQAELGEGRGRRERDRPRQGPLGGCCGSTRRRRCDGRLTWHARGMARPPIDDPSGIMVYPKLQVPKGDRKNEPVVRGFGGGGGGKRTLIIGVALAAVVGAAVGFLLAPSKADELDKANAAAADAKKAADTEKVRADGLDTALAAMRKDKADADQRLTQLLTKWPRMSTRRPNSSPPRRRNSRARSTRARARSIPRVTRST